MTAEYHYQEGDTVPPDPTAPTLMGKDPDGLWRTIAVDADGAILTSGGGGGGTMTTVPAPVDTTTTSVSGSNTVFTILAANSVRQGFVIANNSAQILYVKAGSGASSSLFTWAIPAATAEQIFSLEMPYGLTYKGILTGIMASADGHVMATEFTEAA